MPWGIRGGDGFRIVGAGALECPGLSGQTVMGEMCKLVPGLCGLHLCARPVDYCVMMAGYVIFWITVLMNISDYNLGHCHVSISPASMHHSLYFPLDEWDSLRPGLAGLIRVFSGTDGRADF